MVVEGPRTVVEASWEVVNKVGGIHTVVRTKASLLQNKYENYLLIGPLFPERRDIKFAEKAPPERLRHIFESLRQEGINCVYGTWLIHGEPDTILVNARDANFDLNEIKTELWERFKVDTIHAAWDFNEPLQWAWAVGKLIEQLQAIAEERIVAHLHEWLAGLAGLYLKARDVPCGTVFTTHATMLGRTISGATDWDLFSMLEGIDAEAIAKQLNVMDKFSTERACAHACDAFTTVSDITAMEAEHILGRKPDVILYNGVPEDQSPTMEEASVLHAKSRERIRDFLDYYFFSHYTFDLEQSLILFASGRYEYRNKGFDVFIEALARLNTYLQETDSKKTVIAFFWVPGETHGIKTEVLEERAAFTRMQEHVTKYSRELVRKIIRHASNLDELSCIDLLDEQMRSEVTQLAESMRHAGDPPLCTHTIPHEDQDAIVSALRAYGLTNKQEDKVKAIRHPVYLNGNDGLLDIPYDEVIAGTHLGVFPSAYEPWGYTPVETAALGVPSITTDLAGFGRFVQKSDAKDGVKVLSRQGKSHEEIVDSLFEALKEFCELDKFGRQDRKLDAKRISQLASWQTFINRYYQAHMIAYDA